MVSVEDEFSYGDIGDIIDLHPESPVPWLQSVKSDTALPTHRICNGLSSSSEQTSLKVVLLCTESGHDKPHMTVMTTTRRWHGIVIKKAKCAIPCDECRRGGAHLPFFGLEPAVEKLLVKNYLTSVLCSSLFHDQCAYKPTGSTTCALADFTYRIRYLNLISTSDVS